MYLNNKNVVIKLLAGPVRLRGASYFNSSEVGISGAGFKLTLSTKLYLLIDHLLSPVPNLELLCMFPLQLVTLELKGRGTECELD